MELMDSVRRKREGFSLSVGRKFLLTFVFSLCTGLGMSVLMTFIRQQSVSGMWYYLLENPVAALMTVIFITLAMASLAFITKNLFASGLVVTILSLVLFLVNHFKLLITAVPLQYSDLSLVFQLADITQLNSDSVVFSWRDVLSIIIVVFWNLVLFFFTKPLKLSWKQTLISFAPVAGCFVLVFVVFANSLVYMPLDIPTQEFLSATETEGTGGIILSLWRSVISTEELIDEKLYSEEYMQGILEQAIAYIDDMDAQADVQVNEQDPNVILLLGECFFDIATLDNVEFETDPLEDYRKLLPESVSGTFYTPTFGYGTCNIELNILTGINPELMKSGENPSNWSGEMFEYLPTIPQMLSERGYYTASLHTFNDSIYERSKFFPELGFHDSFFSGDFARIDEEAAAAEDYYEYLATKISGGAYSDDYLSEMIIQLYEQKEDESPVFFYGFTMENHSPYTKRRDGEGFSYKTDALLTWEAKNTLSNLTQGIHNTADAFLKLVDYFSQVDEPTVIVFFGDHRPGAGLTDNSSLFSQLGIVSADSAEWDLAQTEEFFSTEYVVWANDDSLLPGERGSVINSSANYLGLTILESCGVELPLFWEYLKTMNEESTFYSRGYFVSADDQVKKRLNLQGNTSEAKQHKLMRIMLYDTFYGEQYITDKLCEIR